MKGIGLVYLLFFVTFVAADYTKLFEKCTNEKNSFDCFKRKAVDILDRAIKDDTVFVVNDYVSIAKDPATVGDQNTDNNQTKLTLDEQLDKKFHKYLSSRSIKLTVPGDIIEGDLLPSKRKINIKLILMDKHLLIFFVYLFFRT